MGSVLALLCFVILLAFPGIYIITRKMFPHRSRKSTAWISGIATAILVLFLLAMMLGYTW